MSASMADSSSSSSLCNRSSCFCSGSRACWSPRRRPGGPSWALVPGGAGSRAAALSASWRDRRPLPSCQCAGCIVTGCGYSLLIRRAYQELRLRQVWPRGGLYARIIERAAYSSTASVLTAERLKLYLLKHDPTICFLRPCYLSTANVPMMKVTPWAVQEMRRCNGAGASSAAISGPTRCKEAVQGTYASHVTASGTCVNRIRGGQSSAWD